PLTRSYLGFDGKPTTTPGGVACHKDECDQYGNLVRETSLGTGGEPVVDKQQGWCSMAYKYDGHGNPVEVRYLGLSDEPVNISSMSHAIDLMKFDTRGNLTEDLHKDKDGKFVSRFTCEYDQHNRMTTLYHWDSNGKRLPLHQ